MSALNLELPHDTPESLRSGDASFSLRPFALYTLADITEDTYTFVLDRCNSKYGDHDNSVHRPPKYSFVGEPLRAAFDYHLKQEKFDRSTFLAIIDPNWKEKGVYAVTMDNEQGHVDAALISAEDSGLALVNLQIGNSDWPEVKKKYASTGSKEQ